MSKADEMFEKLGYIKNDREDCWLEYCREQFETEKKIAFEKNNQVLFVESKEGESLPISTEELQAINEKVKEWGWLDD